ncbi:MAG: hypothetical protein CMP11_01625, partial [Zetaproteobacteria bacterium]|nr:hypothetical protein [Pseudobdellovibrionaceae bacterium]
MVTDFVKEKDMDKLTNVGIMNKIIIIGRNISVAPNFKKEVSNEKSKNDLSVKDSDLSQEDKQRLLEIEMEMESLE